jgi:hypothetical protein
MTGDRHAIVSAGSVGTGPVSPIQTEATADIFRAWRGDGPGINLPRKESQEQRCLGRFEEVVLPHLDAAFNYARWLTKNDADAEDARAWLLTIVRNVVRAVSPEEET